MENNLEQSTVRVYIAGPYSTGDMAANVRTAIDAGDVLLRAGFTPFIPHLAHFWQIAHSHEYDTWIDWDLSWLSLCDCVLRLPGTSPGADQEVSMADVLHIPVYHSLHETIEKAHPKRRIW